MPEPEKDGAAVRLPPPLVPLAALAAGMILHWIAPLGLPVAGALRWLLAALLVGGGVALLATAFGLFQRTGQDPKPWEPTPEIISTGVYRHTRNPMYVSMGLMQAGLAVALANAWVLLLVPVALWVIQRTAIVHEEAYLEAKFGAAYVDYKRSVRRWL